MAERRVCIVTGAGAGIGAATSRLPAAAGHQIVLAGRRREPLEAVAADSGALIVSGDAATAEGTTAIVDAALSVHGRIDGLVLNAGVMIPGTLVDMAIADWDTVLRVNLTGPALLAKAALPHLLASRGSVAAASSGRRAAGSDRGGRIRVRQSRPDDACPNSRGGLWPARPARRRGVGLILPPKRKE